MEPCTFTSRISAYHDGELSPELRQMMTGHVEECAECRAELDALHSVSQLFLATDSKDLTPMEFARLRAAVTAVEAPEEVPLRLFGGLLAAAASILVVCGAWWLEAPAVAPRMPYVVHESASWERVAMNLRADPEPFMGRAATASADPGLADWMMAGLSK